MGWDHRRVGPHAPEFYYSEGTTTLTNAHLYKKNPSESAYVCHTDE